MDRDVAQKILEKITSVKTTLQAMVTNSTPTAPASRSVSPDPEENQRSAPAEVREEEPEALEEEPEEPEALEEEPEEEPEPVPETTTRKRTTSK